MYSYDFFTYLLIGKLSKEMYIFFCFYAHYKSSGTFLISCEIQRDIIIQAIRPSSNVLDIFGRF